MDLDLSPFTKVMGIVSAIIFVLCFIPVFILAYVGDINSAMDMFARIFADEIINVILWGIALAFITITLGILGIRLKLQ